MLAPVVGLSYVKAISKLDEQARLEQKADTSLDKKNKQLFVLNLKNGRWSHY